MATIPSLGLVARHPVVRDELRAFVRAIVAGRLVKTGKGYRLAKGRANLDREPARAVVEG